MHRLHYIMPPHSIPERERPHPKLFTQTTALFPCAVISFHWWSVSFWCSLIMNCVTCYLRVWCYQYIGLSVCLSICLPWKNNNFHLNSCFGLSENKGRQEGGVTGEPWFTNELCSYGGLFIYQKLIYYWDIFSYIGLRNIRRDTFLLNTTYGPKMSKCKKDLSIYIIDISLLKGDLPTCIYVKRKVCLRITYKGYERK